MDLNHPKVAPFTREVARALRLDPSFVEFVLASEKPECMSYWCEEPTAGWAAWVPDEWEVAYPLWCTGSNPTVILCAGDTHVFAHTYHDSDFVNVVARTAQGLLADLFVNLWENEVEDDPLRDAATACGFRYLDEVLRFEEEHNAAANYRELLPAFIAHIDALDESTRAALS
ncbi:MAG: hypothetical protein KC586_28245 [Myxococcales bacterium]|nr:hypothetical protein [Myxococcales bacterium]